MVDKAVQAPTAKAKAGEEVAVAVWEIPSTTTARTRAPAKQASESRAQVDHDVPGAAFGAIPHGNRQACPCRSRAWRALGGTSEKCRGFLGESGYYNFLFRVRTNHINFLFRARIHPRTIHHMM